MRASTKLRRLLSEPGVIVAPGCWDALTAKLIQHTGFGCAYMSGAATSIFSLGMPDVGLIGMTEMAGIARNIARAVDIPVIGDIDTGFGSALNIQRTIREFETTGLAGVHIEDQINPKRCGHFAGKALVSPQEMVQRIRAAIDAREDPDFVIIARTDAIAGEGLEAAIERGRLYGEAGADALYMEAPRTVEQIRAMPPALTKPVLIGQPDQGLTPLLTVKEFEEMGVKIVTFPTSIRMMAFGAALEILKEIREKGTPREMLDRQGSNEELQRLVGAPEALELLDHYGVAG